MGATTLLKLGVTTQLVISQAWDTPCEIFILLLFRLYIYIYILYSYFLCLKYFVKFQNVLNLKASTLSVNSPVHPSCRPRLIILSGSPLEPSPETIRVGHMSPSMALSSLSQVLWLHLYQNYPWLLIFSISSFSWLFPPSQSTVHLSRSDLCFI